MRSPAIPEGVTRWYTINLNFLPQRQWYNRAPLITRIGFWWPGAAFNLLASGCHAAAQEGAHGGAAINHIKTKGIIQLGEWSMEEDDSNRGLTVGKFCTLPCAVIFQAGIPLTRWIDSSIFFSIPDRGNTEHSPLDRGSADGNLLR